MSDEEWSLVSFIVIVLWPLLGSYREDMQRLIDDAEKKRLPLGWEIDA